MYAGPGGQQLFYQQPQQFQMTQQQPSYQVAYGGQQPPFPVQLTATVQQPEIAKVELEVKKDEKF